MIQVMTDDDRHVLTLRVLSELGVDDPDGEQIKLVRGAIDRELAQLSDRDGRVAADARREQALAQLTQQLESTNAEGDRQRRQADAAALQLQAGSARERSGMASPNDRFTYTRPQPAKMPAMPGRLATLAEVAPPLPTLDGFARDFAYFAARRGGR